jgi:hypothetical protein
MMGAASDVGQDCWWRSRLAENLSPLTPAHTEPVEAWEPAQRLGAFDKLRLGGWGEGLGG